MTRRLLVIMASNRCRAVRAEMYAGDHRIVPAATTVGCRTKIVPHNGFHLQQSALVSYCTQRLAKFEIPERITFVDTLPLTAKGSIDRTKLADCTPNGRWQVSKVSGCHASTFGASDGDMSQRQVNS